MPYDEDPRIARDIYALYATTWPSLPERIRRSAALGWRWDRVSTPFCVHRGGALVAHAGVLELELLVAGRPVRVAGVHAVCTHPEHRRRGYARAAMAQALAWIDDRGLPAELATGAPEVYAPHGFRVVPEHRWRLPASPCTGASRPLCADDPGDRALTERLLATRAPLSERLASLAPSWLFGLCEVLATGGFGHLHHAPELDAILAWEQGEDGTVTVLDVVAPVLPTLDDLMAHLPAAPTVLAFHVDPFGEAAARARGGAPVPGPEDDLWMVRGLEIPEGAGQLPVLARH
jgi:GNAT superfamily N-acetyltransferase